jgi:hypothetical protein
MNQVVAATLTAVAIPYAANVREPVVPVPPRYIVSVVIAIVNVVALLAINAIVVPIGKATELFAGMVAVTVALVKYKCLPASPITTA